MQEHIEKKTRSSSSSSSGGSIKTVTYAVNKSKNIWDLIKDELDQLEKGYNPTTIQNNDNLLSEPTQVAQLFNSYCIEIAEKLQCNFKPGTNKHTIVK